ETLGVLTPKPVEVETVEAGEVGFLFANIKNVADTKIGDTITDDENPAIEPLPGFEEIMPMVFAGLYTVDAHEHTQLREALEKLPLDQFFLFFRPGRFAKPSWESHSLNPSHGATLVSR